MAKVEVHIDLSGQTSEIGLLRLQQDKTRIASGAASFVASSLYARSA